MRRERRILFDGGPAEIHPYDVTVESEAGGEAWDCKWGARGIKADVLHQLDDARRGAGRGRVEAVASAWSCSTPGGRARSGWSGSAGRSPLEGIRLIALESLDRLAGPRTARR